MVIFKIKETKRMEDRMDVVVSTGEEFSFDTTLTFIKNIFGDPCKLTDDELAEKVKDTLDTLHALGALS